MPDFLKDSDLSSLFLVDIEVLLHNRWVALSEPDLSITDMDIDMMEYWRWMDLLDRVQKNWEKIKKQRENNGNEKVNILDT